MKTANAEILSAFKAEEAANRINNTKVGCALVVTLMPLGALLDYFVYPDQLWNFFQIRLWCALAAGVIWAFLYTDVGRKAGWLLGVIVPLLPVVFIAWMIVVKEGFASPYYAGLNLVLLAVGAVLHWTVFESVVAVLLVLFIYIAAGLLHTGLGGPIPETRILVNNFYFIGLMDIIVVVGTFFQHRARFREFVLRFELDQNRKMLAETNRKLVELDEIKSRFFANISHELRTPLTLLLAPLEALLHRQPVVADPQAREWLVTMQTNGMRLLKLINDLLDLVRLESGKIQLKREPLALPAFVTGLCQSVRQVADDKRVQLEAEIEPNLGSMLADRDKLEKILLNLVFNAIKFTPAGGQVRVSAAQQDATLKLVVADTGMGISKAHLPFIFDRFWQADTSARRKYQGTGIGLALVRELVHAHGGEVSVTSEMGQGTTISISLPWLEPKFEPEPAASSDGSAEPPQNEWLTGLYRRAELFPAMTPLQETLRQVETVQTNRPLVLIADDEPDMLRFLKSQLDPQFQVLEAVDGQQAIEKAGEFLPEIILLDMMMPEKDGVQVCQELRARPPTQNIPIILLTARADEETKMAALGAGASDFLTKPFSTTELHVRISNLIASHQLQRRLARQNQVLENTLEQLKETETQLVQSEKMASLGRLSAGIIHEINNPLNYAKTGLFTLRAQSASLPPEERADYDEVLRDVEEGINRVHTIVSDLRTFSHPNPDELDEVRVAGSLTASLRFLSSEWHEKVRIVREVPADLTVLANQNKLTQILVNVLQNSLDALAAKTGSDEPPTIWITGGVTDGRVQLVIRDNGEGIPAANLDKIFDPFFTTRDVGQGMGLGLTISYRLAEECQGKISVDSEAGKYCEVTLEFRAGNDG